MQRMSAVPRKFICSGWSCKHGVLPMQHDVATKCISYAKRVQKVSDCSWKVGHTSAVTERLREQPRRITLPNGH
jgi:hypothetical protein